jgi:hypothetical protein
VILHVLVEGPSERALLEVWGRRFLSSHILRIYPHQGKGRLRDNPNAPVAPRRRGLLDQLPAKLRAFGRVLDARTDRVLVLVNADDQDCEALKARLVALGQQIDPRPEVMFRIAVEETEAFYLGDVNAIRKAFSSVKLTAMKDYEQDAPGVGTWEIFRVVIGASGDDKVQWATQIAPHLSTNPRRNSSPSFRQLCIAMKTLAGEQERSKTTSKVRRRGRGR